MIIRIARHEIAGIVKEIGSNVQRFKVGDQIISSHINLGSDTNLL
jgi:D-arabinose 1-dehydrogenase-like Zn-dependent alcohol dehydrogenase